MSLYYHHHRIFANKKAAGCTKMTPTTTCSLVITSFQSSRMKGHPTIDEANVRLSASYYLICWYNIDVIDTGEYDGKIRRIKIEI